jgi:hypothetical protein
MPDPTPSIGNIRKSSSVTILTLAILTTFLLTFSIALTSDSSFIGINILYPLFLTEILVWKEL